eukprot:3297130-Lingulodinium_polyedra.AAC.1
MAVCVAPVDLETHRDLWPQRGRAGRYVRLPRGASRWIEARVPESARVEVAEARESVACNPARALFETLISSKCIPEPLDAAM